MLNHLLAHETPKAQERHKIVQLQDPVVLVGEFHQFLMELITAQLL